MLGSKPANSYLCERENERLSCVACKEKIRARQIYLTLFEGDPTHGLVFIHRECCRWSIEQMILRREQRRTEQ